MKKHQYNFRLRIIGIRLKRENEKKGKEWEIKPILTRKKP